MRVSVIIPCYNVEAYVGRAVESALAQTHSDLEVIAVDDGSTDGTLAILQELQARHPDRMQVIAQANAGACAARNAGLERSTGHYLEFLDADDVIHPTKVAHQLALAASHDHPELIAGSATMRSPEGDVLRQEVLGTTPRDPWFELMRHGLGGSPQNLWKRSAVAEVGGWDESLRSSQEYDLMFRMMQRGARVVIDDALLTDVYLRKTGSISQGRQDRNWERFIDLRVRILDHLARVKSPSALEPYRQVLFDSIRTLYPHAPQRAAELYRTHLRGFAPQRSPATGAGYLLLHRILGFSWANRLRHLLR